MNGEWTADEGDTNHGQVDLMTKIEIVITACTKEWGMSAVDVIGSLRRVEHEFQIAVDEMEQRMEEDE